MQAARSRDTAAQDYEHHRRPVMGMLAKRFPRFDENERLEIYHEAWARVFAKRRRGEEIHSLRAYLLQTAAAEAMNAVTRKRPPVPVGPDDPAVTGLPDNDLSVEERVLIRDQVRLARELIDSLEGRQRDLLKLRWNLQLSASEIRSALGLSDRQYQRLAEEGAEAIASRVRDLEDGTWSRRQRSLLTACLIDVGDIDSARPGIASDAQRAEAQRLLESDPHVAALYMEVRGALRRAAAILPLPAIPLGDGILNALILDRVGAATEKASAFAGNVKQQAMGTYLRATDATLFAGASPTTVLATVAGAAAIGGGAYVATEVMPTQKSIGSELTSTASKQEAISSMDRDSRLQARRRARREREKRNPRSEKKPKIVAPGTSVQSPSPVSSTEPQRSEAPSVQPKPVSDPNEFNFEN